MLTFRVTYESKFNSESTMYPKASRCFAVILLILELGSLKAGAQAETKGEKEQREDVQAMRDRRAEAASTAKAHSDIAAQNALRLADEAELKRIRAAAPEREAAARASEAAERNARAANEKAYLRRASAAMDAAHIRDRKQAVDDLFAHPIPVPAPGSVTECDSLAAAAYDTARPLGLDGVLAAQMNPAAAVAACREGVEKDPVSVRARFELARALTMAGRCDEAMPALESAIGQGSAAAAYLYAALLQPSQQCASTPRTMSLEDGMRRAWSMKNPDAGLFLVGLLWKQYFHAKDDEKNTAKADEFFKQITPIQKQVLELIHDRVAARDNHALYIQATIAQATGSEFFGYNSIYVLYQCVVRGYPLCKQFDRFQ